MKQYKYIYVTEMAPNGTNDLLLMSEDGDCVDLLEEATFGIDVSLKNGFELYDSWVRDISHSVDLIMRKAAVSPVRDRGEAESRIRKFLMRKVA